MKTILRASIAAIGIVAVAAGCQAGLAPHVPSPAPGMETAKAVVYPSPTPYPAPHLYVDHDGLLSVYRLPLHPKAKPVRELQELPGSANGPAIAIDRLGEIAVATPTEVRIYKPPVTTMAPNAASLHIPLTPANTRIGATGADIVDMQWDPNLNLWLISGSPSEVTELQRPLKPSSVAASTVLFGVTGTKAAGFPIADQARFDVNATLYVYAIDTNLPAPQSNILFKVGFPYVAPIGTTGLSLATPDFIDPSQYLPTNPNPLPLLIGAYNGPLHSPPPQQPPPPPVSVLAEFSQPLNPIHGPYPIASVNVVVGALIADPPRTLFYTLDSANGRLRVWGLPLYNDSTAKLTLPCTAGKKRCNGQTQHVWLGN